MTKQFSIKDIKSITLSINQEGINTLKKIYNNPTLKDKPQEQPLREPNFSLTKTTNKNNNKNTQDNTSF